MNVLFVCTYNEWRSKTAEKIFRNAPALSVRSAGTSPTARIPLSQKLIDWAEIVFVMETRHKEVLKEKFQTNGKKIVVLDIDSGYRYMDPELVKILQDIVPRYLEKE